jgi:hypothetical protein
MEAYAPFVLKINQEDKKSWYALNNLVYDHFGIRSTWQPDTPEVLRTYLQWMDTYLRYCDTTNAIDLQLGIIFILTRSALKPSWTRYNRANEIKWWIDRYGQVLLSLSRGAVVNEFAQMSDIIPEITKYSESSDSCRVIERLPSFLAFLDDDQSEPTMKIVLQTHGREYHFVYLNRNYKLFIPYDEICKKVFLANAIEYYVDSDSNLKKYIQGNSIKVQPYPWNVLAITASNIRQVRLLLLYTFGADSLTMRRNDDYEPNEEGGAIFLLVETTSFYEEEKENLTRNILFLFETEVITTDMVEEHSFNLRRNGYEDYNVEKICAVHLIGISSFEAYTEFVDFLSP